ncbi:unnamed protein product, partial [marine sediment metagenome]
ALQSDKSAVDSDLEAAEAQLTALQAQVADLQQQVADLIAQYEFTGLSTAEMAETIVENYHATHVYSTWDMFVCSDMASEVWNMLKAQGINARVVVGNIDTVTPITDILQSDHAWVLAEISPEEYLALETTAGYVVTRSENSLYYHGWYFDSPADLKSNNDLIKEHNLRVEFRNQINVEIANVAILHDNSTTQQEADEYLAVYNKLVELRTAQETLINQLKEQISQLATQLQ